MFLALHLLSEQLCNLVIIINAHWKCNCCTRCCNITSCLLSTTLSIISYITEMKTIVLWYLNNYWTYVIPFPILCADTVLCFFVLSSFYRRFVIVVFRCIKEHYRISYRIIGVALHYRWPLSYYRVSNHRCWVQQTLTSTHDGAKLRSTMRSDNCIMPYFLHNIIDWHYRTPLRITVLRRIVVYRLLNATVTL